MIDLPPIDALVVSGVADLSDIPLTPGRRRSNAGTEVGGDDFIEALGDAIFEDVQEQLDAAETRTEFGSDIDGLDPDERTSHEARAMDETLDDLDDDDVLDIEVIVVDAGEAETVVTDDGTAVGVFLGEHEGSRLLNPVDDDMVLLIDKDMSFDQAIDEIVEANATLITEIAEEHGVDVDHDGLRLSLHYRAHTVLEQLYQLDVLRATFGRFGETVRSDFEIPFFDRAPR